MTMHAFGDSITAGAGASSPANSYIGKLNASLGITIDNAAVSTSMVMDQTPSLYARTISPGDKSIVMLGTNDQAKYDSDPSKRGYYIDGLRAFCARLGSVTTPINPSTAQLGGAWSNGYAFGCYATSAPGASAAFTVTGDTIILGMLRQYNNSATFSVMIDGVAKGTFSVGGDVRTILGAAYGAMDLAFPGLGAGSHMVEISVISANAANVVFLQWFSGCVPNGGQVVLGNIPHALAYTYGGSAANVDAYNSSILALSQEMAGYGLNVSLVDVCGALVPLDMHDNVHPADSGHSKIFNLFYTALAGVVAPPTMTPAQVYFGSDGFPYIDVAGVLKKLVTA
jgi:lysophospholipase L1-like esterase